MNQNISKELVHFWNIMLKQSLILKAKKLDFLGPYLKNNCKSDYFRSRKMQKSRQKSTDTLDSQAG